MKDIKKTNWFEERELPNIENDNDLLKAFSIVKNRFNGNPRCYTRNDYILFINTIYAAFRDLYYSTHLQKDITTDIKVGFVDKGTVLEKGTSLQKIMEMIFIGNGEEPEPEPPVVEENVIYTNIVNPVGKEYYAFGLSGIEHKSNLSEGTTFVKSSYSSELLKDINKVSSDYWGYINKFENDQIFIETYKPLDTIISKIQVHQPINQWPLQDDIPQGEWSVYDWFVLESTSVIDNNTKYRYKLNLGNVIDHAVSFDDADILIKIIF